MFGRSAGVALVGFCVLASACSEPRTYRSAPARTGPADPGGVAELRLVKDREFQSGPDSPIPAEDRAKFSGLSYFPPDPRLKYRLALHRFPAPQAVRLGTNTGELREALRYGYFEFEVDGQSVRLHAYRTEEPGARGGPRLFIPFRDATSGRETYSAGRYLELPENTTGTYDLDFNLAFNPYCAYNSRFSCPVPPLENHLQVAIRAGERKYPLARGDGE